MGRGHVVFDRVWKRFRRGERHDSLRDLIPALVRGTWRRPEEDELGEQEFWALSDVSFEVKPGEALGVIGPNGAGKSTALKLLSRIMKPTRGHCEIRGRAGALIDLSAGFHLDLTGRENVYLRGAILGMSRAETAARFDDIVSFAGLEDFIDTPVKRYSTGMNARLGFAIAAQMTPDVLIVDEVLGVGDAEFRERCHERMAALKQAGVVIVVVSHNLAAIRALCDRTLLLRHGTTDYLGDTDAAIRRYADPEPKPAAADSGSALEVISIRDAAGRTPPRLQPGDPLLVTIHVKPDQVAADGLLVTHIRARQSGVVASNTRQPIDLGAWAGRREGCQLTIQLTANLLRGSYSVAFSLLDVATRVRHRTAPFIIRIDDRFSTAGIAHVATSVTASDAVAAAAPRPG